MIIENKIVQELFKRNDLDSDQNILAIINLSGLCTQALCRPDWFTPDEIESLKSEGNRLFGFSANYKKENPK